MPAVMPAQSAIAGIAAGHRTIAVEQEFCLQATGYGLPLSESGYSVLAAISEW